jgi:hypothetical protein
MAIVTKLICYKRHVLDITIHLITMIQWSMSLQSEGNAIVYSLDLLGTLFLLIIEFRDMLTS